MSFSHPLFRGLFIIDGKGIIRYMGVNDLGVGRSVDEVMRLVKAFKFTEVHGEMCPAGWKPDNKSKTVGICMGCFITQTVVAYFWLLAVGTSLGELKVPRRQCPSNRNSQEK